MTLTVKRISPTHSEIWDGDKWIATVNTQDAPDRAESVKKAIEDAERLTA